MKNQKNPNEDLMSEIKGVYEYCKFKFKETHDKKSLEIDVNDIIDISPQLHEALLAEPRKILNLLDEGTEGIFIGQNKQIKLTNLNNPIDIHKIRVKDLNHIFNIKGIIKRITKVIPRTEIIRYRCTTCGAVIEVSQSARKKEEPRRCTSCGIKKTKFEIDNEEIKNIQELNLEEIQESLEGKQPQQLRVYLEDELTDGSLCTRLQPGRRIEVIGIIEKLPTFMTAKDEETNLSEFMLYANNIISLEAEDDLSITPEDEIKIKEIAKDDPLQKLADSLIPEVYGNDMIKKALVLQTVKGVAKEKSDGTFSREDINILLVGDLGVAKSVSLKAVTTRNPKSRMIVGTKTSRVGLGAMCVKDELTQNWALEIGPLILCNGGLLCIDELDKMYKEHLNDLLEPMSASTVTITKAGIHATLPAHTSILASANPIYGNYDLTQPLAKQIDLPSPILNRFDLIFIMIDRPDEDFDSKAVEHIFKSYKEKIVSEIPIDLFKKYIIYCKKLKPILADNLINYIQEFYINLREKSKRPEVKSIPINLRNMEALVKIAESHAKLRLSPVVEIEDLNVAKNIFMFCIKQIGIDDDTGAIDMSRTFEKMPLSKRAKMEKFLEMIYNLCASSEEIYYSTIIEEGKRLGMKSWEVNIFLETLQKEAKIYEPTKGVYKIVPGGM